MIISDNIDDEPAVRRAGPSDAAGMKACAEEAYRHYLPRIGRPPGPMLDDYSQVVRSHQAFVAEADGEIVGILVLVRTGDRLLLDNVAVRPDRQGKGLGRRLVTLAETEARQQGYAHLDLYTNEAMTENIGLYQSLGYTVTERTAEYGYRRVYMRKTLK